MVYLNMNIAKMIIPYQLRFIICVIESTHDND